MFVSRVLAACGALSPAPLESGATPRAPILDRAELNSRGQFHHDPGQERCPVGYRILWDDATNDCRKRTGRAAKKRVAGCARQFKADLTTRKDKKPFDTRGDTT